MELLKNIYPRVPVKHRDEFERDLLRDNFDRLAVISTVFFVVEAILLCFPESLLNTGNIILAFLGINIILVPAIWYVKKNVEHINTLLAKIVEVSYCLACLIFGCALALFAQTANDFTYMYVVFVFGITSGVFAKPLTRAILLFSVCLGYLYLFSYIQTNQELIFVTRINVVILNGIAWLLGNMLFGMRLSSFLDKKLMYDLIQKDAMTDLLNHNAVIQRLEIELTQSKRIGYPLSLILMDIDDFKQVNDCHGHLIGDEVIMGVADAIVATARSTDIVGRYGGDEFIIVLPDTDLEEAMTFSKRIRKTVDELTFDYNSRVSLSGGISQYAGGSKRELIQMADIALYKAKKLGKGCFVVSERNIPELDLYPNDFASREVSAG